MYITLWYYEIIKKTIQTNRRMIAMDTFEKIIQLSEERLITPSGLFLVGQLLGKSRFIKKCNTMKVDSKRSQSQIKNGDILLSYIGLLCQGKTIYVGSLWKAVNYTDVEGNSKTVTTRIVYKVIERTMDKNGQLLIMPDIE